MIRFATWAAAALLAVPAAAAPPVNAYHQRILRMDDATRNGVMRRAVTDNGERCGRLDRASYRGRYRNLEMWAVRCTPGGDYGVFIGADASVQVRACDTLRELRLPPCEAPRPRTSPR